MNVKILHRKQNEIIREYENVGRISMSGDGGAINVDFLDDRVGETITSANGKMVEVCDESVDGHFEELVEMSEPRNGNE